MSVVDFFALDLTLIIERVALGATIAENLINALEKKRIETANSKMSGQS